MKQSHCAFDLYQTHPSFEEEKPFVRLNLSGKGPMVFYNEKGLAQVSLQQTAWTCLRSRKSSSPLPKYSGTQKNEPRLAVPSCHGSDNHKHIH